MTYTELVVEGVKIKTTLNLYVRREPISKSCVITRADNLNCRRRLSRKVQCLKIEVAKVIKIFLA